MIWTPKSAEEMALPKLELKGFKVVLRPPQPDHCEEWLGVRKRNQRFLQKYEPAWSKDANSSSYFYRRLARQYRDWYADRAYPFLIFKVEDDSLIGGINILHVARGAAQYAMLGYWLDAAHQGQGYMLAAMRLTIYFAYNDLKLHRLNAAVLTTNQRSIKLLKRMGFAEEGFAREYIEICGEWQDHKLFGLILKEFMAKEGDG